MIPHSAACCWSQHDISVFYQQLRSCESLDGFIWEKSSPSFFFLYRRSTSTEDKARGNKGNNEVAERIVHRNSTGHDSNSNSHGEGERDGKNQANTAAGTRG